jgi:lysozyme inhibitor LprI
MSDRFFLDTNIFVHSLDRRAPRTVPRGLAADTQTLPGRFFFRFWLGGMKILIKNDGLRRTSTTKEQQMSHARHFRTVAICLLCAPALAAPKAAPADRAAINQCLVHDKKGNGEACVGIVADPCMAAVNSRASYDDDAKVCAVRELAVWNEFLQETVKGLKSSGGPDLAEAQSNWLKSREEMCPLFDNIDPGMYLGGSEYCRLQETGRRYLILDKLLRAVSEH